MDGRGGWLLLLVALTALRVLDAHPDRAVAGTALGDVAQVRIDRACGMFIDV